MKGRPKTATPLNNGVQVRLPPELRERLDAEAKKRGGSISGLIRQVLMERDQQQAP
jgi:predicted DNA-binding protein